MVLDYGPNAGKLTVGTRVWLQGDLVVVSDCRQHLLQLSDHESVAESLVLRGEWVNLGKARISDRVHHVGGVQLHGAAA